MQDKLNELFNVRNKCVLITGASGFFGRHIARTFLELGSRAILLGRSNRLSGMVRGYRKTFGKDMVFGFRTDLYKRKKSADILKKIVRKFDIDVLINNAYDFSKKTGFNTPLGHLENSSYKQWKSAFESGIYWTVLPTQIVGRQFKNKRKGSIINISSMYGVVSPNPKLYKGTSFFNPPAYSTAKSAIIAFTRYTASFWGRYGVRCNAVLPGPFPNMESKGNNSINSGDFFLNRLKNNTVFNKVGHPDDLKGILVYLACDASSFMTGQTVIIDGGWTIV